MKRSFVLIAFMLTSIHFVFSGQIDSVLARKAAMNFLTISKGQNTTTLTELSVWNENGQNTLYLFFSDRCFVLVTADNNMPPIAAYSIEGGILPGKMPPAMHDLIITYSKVIAAQIRNSYSNEDNRNQWENLLQGHPIQSGTKAVLPLISTVWAQDCYYNALCPFDTLGPCDHAVTGCVATAMAQVMKYWNHPVTGTGSHSYNSNWYGNQTADFGSTTYDWSSMPDSVGSPNNAVATLMYHCGVAVEMDYYATSSSSYLQTAPLADYFSYSRNMYLAYADNFSAQEWIDLLKSEIDSGRPMVYSGMPHDTLWPMPGHAWVVDGYDNSDFFHFNWGWGYWNSYWAMGTFNFSYHNSAIINMMPAADCDIIVKEITWPVHKTFTAPEPVKIKVANYDNVTLNNIPLAYQIDGGIIIRDTLYGPLAPNTDTIFTFSVMYDFSTNPGHFYNIKAFAGLACDAYRLNDTISVSVENVICVTPPYNNGFEPTDSQNGWFTENNNNDGYQWTLYNTGSGSAWQYYLEG